VIRGGGQSSGPMILKPRAKGAQGSEDHLCKRNCLVAGPISGWSSMSEGGSHLDVGGETTMGKEASASFFLLIGGGERERGAVPVQHVGDGWPTAHRSGETTARHRVPCSLPLTSGPQSGF
jgi:hypothetical protein